jgi:integrase
MSVALRRQRDGTLRKFWYGEYVDENGKRVVKNLGEWRGTPPPYLTGKGDATTGNAIFEASRKAAEELLRADALEHHRKGRSEHLLERLIESKTGHAVEHCRIADLAERWLSMPRGGELTAPHVSGVRAVCARFTRFMARRNVEAVLLYQVEPADAAEFATTMRAAYAPSVARRYMLLLRSAFGRFMPPGTANPFAGIVSRIKGDKGNGGMVHRIPFTAEELQLLIDAARTSGADMLADLITAGACTGLRRGDLCRLKWTDVDLTDGMVSVKTSKTGECVEVPIFAPLRSVLDGRKGNKSAYVFPEAASMLEENPDGLTWRFKSLVATTLAKKDPKAPAAAVPVATIADEGAAAIAARISDGPRRERMLDTLRLYAAGESVRNIETSTGRPRATVSTDLRLTEAWIGKRFMRSNPEHRMRETINTVTRVTRAHGQRAASVRDWHALRTTFCTIALSAGVPMELVRRVTGHATVDVVLKHYFKPGREQFRMALKGALPAVLTGGAKHLPPADELAALVEKIKAGTATAADKKRLRVVAAKI